MEDVQALDVIPVVIVDVAKAVGVGVAVDDVSAVSSPSSSNSSHSPTASSADSYVLHSCRKIYKLVSLA